MDDSSTEVLLFNSGGITGSEQSTASLIEGCISHSTSSLIHKNVEELLKDVKPQNIRAEITEDVLNTKADLLSEYSTEQDYSVTNIFKDYTEYNIRNSEKEYREDPLLSVLFNKIQVFLLRNNLSLDFLIIFKRYIDILGEVGLNPLDDDFVLMLQNELDKTWELTANMTKILSAFLIQPENTAMKLAFFEHKLRRASLRGSFTKWKLSSQSRQSLEQLNRIWERSLLKKFLHVWKQKAGFLKGQLVIEADNFLEFRLKSDVLDGWITKMDSQMVKRTLADTYFLEKHFKRLNKKLSTIHSHSCEAARLRDRMALKGALIQWKLKNGLKKFKTHANSKLEKTIIRKWQNKLKEVTMLKERADFMRKCLLNETYFNKWLACCCEKSHEEDELKKIEVAYVQKKVFELLKNAIKERESEFSVRELLNLTLIRFFFCRLWFKRFEERKRLRDILFKSDNLLKNKCLTVFKVTFSLSKTADGFYEKKQLSKRFRQIRLKEELVVLQRKKESNLIANTFKKWRKNVILHSKLSFIKRRQLQAFWAKYLRNKLMYYSDWESIAKNYNELVLKRRFFVFWSDRGGRCNELEYKANFFIRLRAIRKLKAAIVHSQDVKKQAALIGSKCERGYLLKSYLRNWLSTMVIQRRLRLETILDQYLKEREIDSEGRIFDIWYRKLRFYVVACVDVANGTQNRNLRKGTFDSLLKKTSNYRDWSETADELRNKSLVLFTFSAFKERFAEVKAMEHMVHVRIRSENLNLLIKCMNKWTMRQLKCRRNEETVEVFKNRWNRAGLRAIILLWRDKIDEPLRKHSKNTQGRRFFDDGEEAESLVTPTRVKPKDQITIPGSEIIKKKRMEAMRNHYRNARRAIPSPVKSSDTLDSVSKRKLARNDIEGSSFAGISRSPPPKMDLEKVNKKLATSRASISFKRIPEQKFSPFMSPAIDDRSPLVIDRSALVEIHKEINDSPTRR